MTSRQTETWPVTAADRDCDERFDMLLRNCEIAAGLYLNGKRRDRFMFREYVRPFYREWWTAHEACNGRIGKREDADQLVMHENLIRFYTR